jgi:hypothetical protein
LRLFELRTYHTDPGRLEALNQLTREHTLALFKKHGLTPVAYWIPSDKPNTLIYVLSFPNMAAHDKAWAEFYADPDWKKALDDAQKDSPLLMKDGVESVLMSATDYSPMK